MSNLFGSIFSTANLGKYQYLHSIVTFLDGIVVPLTIVLLAAAAIMAIIIGVALAKADSGDKAQEMKKRLVGLIVTCFIVIALVWLLGFILSRYGEIMDFIRGVFSGDTVPEEPGIPETPIDPGAGGDPGVEGGGTGAEGGTATGIIRAVFAVARLCGF